jgi:Tol biopolymer transport system component
VIAAVRAAAGVICVIAALGPLGSAAADSAPKLRVRTLLETRGLIEGFAQDGNRILWADSSKASDKYVRLRDLRTGKTWALTARTGGTCSQRPELGGMQHVMALAGKRALWAYLTVSNSAYHFTVYGAAPGDRRERRLDSIHILGGLAREGPFRPVPMAGSGSILAFADISNAEENNPVGVYRVARRTTLMDDTHYTDALAASSSRIALGRKLPGGCVCNAAPTWSRDGTQVAFISGASGDELFTRELHVVDTAGGRARTLKAGIGVTDVQWSPTGASILFGRNFALYVLAAPDGRPRFLARGASGRWSPDGSEIAYWAYDRGEHYLFVIPAEGKPRKIAPGSYPQWAPDGRSLLARRDDGLYVVPLDGSAARRITPKEPWSYAWAPDASQIAFADDDGTHVVRPDGSGERQISARASVEWSPDSRWLAGVNTDGSLVLFAADGGIERRLPAVGRMPAWSRDGSTIVFVSSEPGDDGEVAVIGLDGSGKRILTSTTPMPRRSLVELRRPNGTKISSFVVTAEPSAIALDGARVALLGTKGKHRSLQVWSSGGHLLRRLSVPQSTSPDYVGLAGRWVVFYSRGGIRLLDWRSGRVSLLELVRYPVGISVEGNRVAWAEQSRKGSRIRAAMLPQ